MGKIQIIINSLLVIIYQSTLAAKDDCKRPSGLQTYEMDCNRGKLPLIIAKCYLNFHTIMLHCYDLFLLIYQNICIVGGGFCETISLSSKEEDTIASWPASFLGTYKWIGMTTKNNAPLYKLDSKDPVGFLIKEWGNANNGYNGWKVVVIVT